MPPLLRQALDALAYYAGVLAITRLAGKRIAGQTTTFDLIVLIGLTVVLQTSLLSPGAANALVFVAVVLAAHRSVSMLCARSPGLRRLLRGAPRPLVRDGRILAAALEAEGVSEDELRAGLRKLGYASPEDVRLAVLEETGHISALPIETRGAT